ncbi:unnamed protein product, partial [Symbiodinium necroappetens]
MFVSAAVWCLVLAAPDSVSAHDVDVLPYVLGTVTRPPEWIAEHNRKDRKRFKEATCSFGAVGLVSNLARLSFQMKNIVEQCPKSAEDTLSHQPGDEATIAEKVCLLSTTAIFSSLAQISRSIVVLASTCTRTASVAEACAASVQTLLVPWSLIIDGGVIISAVCDKAVSDADLLPKGIQPGRRLTGMELPKSRQADIAQCVFDAVDASRAIASIGLSLDLVSRSCPVNRITRFTEKLSTAACTVDVSILLTAFTKLSFYLALAVNHCSPYKERDAVCLAGVTAIAAGLSTASAGGAGAWATCEVGNKNKLIKEAAARDAAQAEEAEEEVQAAILKAAPFNVVRRLREENSSGSEVRRLEETFLRLGYNLSDDQADWLQESSEILELRSFADDVVRQMQTFRPVQPAQEMDTLKLELSELSEIPAVPADLHNESETLQCSTNTAALEFRSGLAGQAPTLEDNVSACQARCSRIPSCAAFAYWTPGRQCHALGHLRMPTARPHGKDGWVSGPPGCREEQVSAAARVLATRHRDCYHPHASYHPVLETTEPQFVQSALHCQEWCQRERHCAYFSYFTLSGLCSLSAASATKLQPVLNFVAGPRACSDLVGLAKEPEFELWQLPKESALGYAPAGLVIVAVALTLAVSFFKGLPCRKSFECFERSFTPVPQAQPDDAGSVLLEEHMQRVIAAEISDMLTRCKAERFDFEQNLRELEEVQARLRALIVKAGEQEMRVTTKAGAARKEGDAAVEADLALDWSLPSLPLDVLNAILWCLDCDSLRRASSCCKEWGSNVEERWLRLLRADFGTTATSMQRSQGRKPAATSLAEYRGRLRRFRAMLGTLEILKGSGCPTGVTGSASRRRLFEALEMLADLGAVWESNAVYPSKVPGILRSSEAWRTLLALLEDDSPHLQWLAVRCLADLAASPEAQEAAEGETCLRLQIREEVVRKGVLVRALLEGDDIDLVE